MSQNQMRAIDLFSGCGGLSLGFDAFSTPDGHRPFRTVLALDNWPAATKIFNQNFAKLNDGKVSSVGRVADLSWFDHPSEALLYYLVHLAHTTNEPLLTEALQDIGVSEFLKSVYRLDITIGRRLADISASASYQEAFKAIDQKVFSLAAFKSAMNRLHLGSLKDLRLSGGSLPWTEECSRVAQDDDHVNRESLVPVEAYLKSAERIWDQFSDQILKSASKTGRGQHSHNASRMASLAGFLGETTWSSEVREAWIHWYASRLSLREEFCLSNYNRFRALYTDDRRVQLVLGGPPCKGFSRIGRAVIRELRAQGAHAWASDQFGDERNALMYRYVIFLEALLPDVFVFENVSNFASTLKTPNGELNAPQVLEELISSLDCQGRKYSVAAEVIKAKQHGIPQARERYIMCGVSSAQGDLDPVALISIPQSSGMVSLGDAIGGLREAKIFSRSETSTAALSVALDYHSQGLPEALARYLLWVRGPDPLSGECPQKVDSHIYREPRADDKALYGMLAPGVRWMDLKVPKARSLQTISGLIDEIVSALDSDRRTEALEIRIDEARKMLSDSFALRLILEQISSDLGEEHHLLSDGYLANGSGQHGDWLERLSASKPCKTIVAHIGKDTYGYVHPYEDRPITIREAARIQTFPDWFSFLGVGVVDAYSMIGNAVPPLLARAFAERIWTSLSGELVLQQPFLAKRKTIQHRLALEIFDKQTG